MLLGLLNVRTLLIAGKNGVLIPWRLIRGLKEESFGASVFVNPRHCSGCAVVKLTPEDRDRAVGQFEAFLHTDVIQFQFTSWAAQLIIKTEDLSF